MSEIDPIVARVLLKGDDEFLATLKKVGTEGVENFEKFAEAVEKNVSPLKLLSEAIGGVEVAISAAAAGMVLFIEQQTELSQATELLADAFGATAGQLLQLEALFASSGVKVEQFERFATRLTTTIAREWPQITESIRRYADENDAAQLRVSNAINHVSEAQTKLQFASAHAAQEQVQAQQSIRGAELSASAARQRLSELESGPISAAEKKSLEVEQARLAVQQADERVAEARTAQAEKAAGAAAKALEAENALKAAVIAKSEADEKANKLALTSIPTITSALGGVRDGNAAIAHQIDLAQVSIQHLKQGVIELAAEQNKTGGKSPSGLQTLQTMTELFTKSQQLEKDGFDPLISKEQKLALVTALAGTSMQALGKSASEILEVLETSSTKIEDIVKAANALSAVDPTTVKDFRSALFGLNNAVSILNQTFAAWAAPAFTDFLNSIKAALPSSTTLLASLNSLASEVKNAFSTKFVQDFVEGLKLIGEAFLGIAGAIKDVAKALNDMGLTIPALILAARIFGGAWLTIPIAITAAVAALGYLADKMREIQAWGEKNQELFIALKAAITAIGVVIAVAMLPLLPWTAIIGAIGAGVFLIYQHWDAISDAIGRAKDTALNYISEALGGISDAELKRRNAAREAAAANREAAMHAQAEATAKKETAEHTKTSAATIESSTKSASSGWDKDRGGTGDMSMSHAGLAEYWAAVNRGDKDAYANYTGQKVNRGFALPNGVNINGDNGLGGRNLWATPDGIKRNDQDQTTKAQAAGTSLETLSKSAEHASDALEKIAVPKTSVNTEEPSVPISRAGGGPIDGPGTNTSDSIIARVSRGEFVMRAAAVQQWGSDFMSALNAGIFPGFAAGGMVPSPVRMGGGSGSMPATSTLNLSIDGRSFGGLRGPKSTVDDLTSFAISRQTSQAGNKPSWYK